MYVKIWFTVVCENTKTQKNEEYEKAVLKARVITRYFQGYLFFLMLVKIIKG
jgi:hypothetical protein